MPLCQCSTMWSPLRLPPIRPSLPATLQQSHWQVLWPLILSSCLCIDCLCALKCVSCRCGLLCRHWSHMPLHLLIAPPPVPHAIESVEAGVTCLAFFQPFNACSAFQRLPLHQALPLRCTPLHHRCRHPDLLHLTRRCLL